MGIKREVPAPANPKTKPKAKPKPRDWNAYRGRLGDHARECEAQRTALMREMIERALEESHNEVTVAAKLLGIGRGKLYGDMAYLQIKSGGRARGRSAPSAMAKRQRRWT